jgi:subtilisin
MLRKIRRAPVIAILVAITLIWSAAGATAAVRASVIVVFDDDVANPAALAGQLGRAHGFEARHVYGSALKGFSAAVPLAALPALSAHPRVYDVELETREPVASQTLPTGADRIEVDKNTGAGVGVDGPTIDIDVAILDTGINSHPDLNIAGGYSGSPGDTWADVTGHGTHVAGIVGAIDNDLGVVGVAPGVRLWSVRVCREDGFCYSTDVVAGIDWLVARKNDFKSGRAGGINFAAANYSISSPDTTSSCNAQNKGVNATHSAICRLVSSGVVFVMAAGNNVRLKNAYPEAFTVAAVTDFDGKAGGFGAPTCRYDIDDQLAHFSNWGVDIAAPGTCILSTASDGDYVTFSGTSMSTPYVSGAIALYLHVNNKAPATNKNGVIAIENAIVGAALPQAHACGYVNHRGTDEKLLFVNDVTHFRGTGECEVADPPPPPNTPPAVSISSPTDGSTFTTDDTITFTGSALDEEDGDVGDDLVWTSSLQGEIGAGASFSSSLAEGTHTITAAATDSEGLTGSASVSVSVTVEGGEEPPPPPPPPSTTMSASLSGSSANNGSTWTATAMVLVTDGSGVALSGVLVSGSWNGAGSVSCTTASNGTCSVSLGGVLKRVGSVSFAVTDVALVEGYTYSGDYPSIVISKP